MSIKDKISKCLKEGKKGERHKGLKKIDISGEDIKGYLNKAVHNFKAMTEFQKIGFSDWSASAAFYCLYHCLLALLTKEGLESRNQSCTFAYIEDMIETSEFHHLYEWWFRELNHNLIVEFRLCSKTTNHICDKQHATSL